MSDAVAQLPPRTFWRVEPRMSEDGTPDINFCVEKAECPQEQRELKSAVERALTVVKALYSHKDDKKLTEAVAKLVSLSQVGLVGPNASPAIAMDALRALEADIVEREAGPIKNAYMRKLGFWAAILGGGTFASYLIMQAFPYLSFPQIQAKRNVLLVWTGCMAGTWASFATRKVSLAFSDLIALEEDRIEPQLRLLFTGTLTVILSLIFITGLADVQIGSFEASLLKSSGSVALLIGAFAGLAEKALPSAVLSRADNVLATTRAA